MWKILTILFTLILMVSGIVFAAHNNLDFSMGLSSGGSITSIDTRVTTGGDTRVTTGGDTRILP